jgi:hypothetical protein
MEKKMTGISKIEMAKRIVEGNPNASRKEVIEMFIDRLGMSKAGATTYAYNIMKGAPKAPKAKKVAAEAPTAEIAPEVAVDAKKESRLNEMRKVLAKMKAE